MEGTMRCAANYVPLSPITFLLRSGLVYKDRTSIVHGELSFTWGQTLERCTMLASALTQLGVSRGDVVATLSPNIPALYELHFGVPMAGGVISVLNPQFDSEMVSVLLKHAEAKIVFVDSQFLDVAKAAIEILSKTSITGELPRIIVLTDHSDQASPATANTAPEVSANGDLEYERVLAMGKSDFSIKYPNDELDPISISFTSGTTSNPKAVVYSHRGAYLNSLGTLLVSEMTATPVYLWTVPMFHCNGWCLAWGMAAQGGKNICLRNNVSVKDIFDKIVEYEVTHLGGAPSLLNMIANASASEKKPIVGRVVSMLTGGATPPAEVLLKMNELGFRVTHAYGSTETYGAATFCAWNPEWNSLPPREQAKINSLQGFRQLFMEEVDVKDPDTMASVPADAKTVGEVMVRGNTIMSGYLKDEKATRDAFEGGWFRTRDFGVKHPDGVIQVKDRSVDIIVSGGNYISTIEVESVLFSHPAVLEAAVAGRPDDILGETPCAFVKLKEGCEASADELIRYCRDHLPYDYMAPQTVVFEDFKKTATGKTQKYVLRQKAKAMGSLNTTSSSNVSSA